MSAGIVHMRLACPIAAFLGPARVRNFFPADPIVPGHWEDNADARQTLFAGYGGPVSFDVKDDAATVSRNWKASLAVKCPHCGDTHAVAFKRPCRRLLTARCPSTRSMRAGSYS